MCEQTNKPVFCFHAFNMHCISMDSLNDFSWNCYQLTAFDLKHPDTKLLYDMAKRLDTKAEKERSNPILLQALEGYQSLLLDHKKNLNDTIFKEIAERCVERMRFAGKLKAAVAIHNILIERFDDEPNYRNQLAVTYLLGNQ